MLDSNKQRANYHQLRVKNGPRMAKSGPHFAKVGPVYARGHKILLALAPEQFGNISGNFGPIFPMLSPGRSGPN